MSKVLRAAMIGIGSMGRGHLDNYLRLEKEGYPIKVVALCDVDEKKFTNYKADFNIGEVGADGYDFASFNLYTDLDEMLAKESSRGPREAGVSKRGRRLDWVAGQCGRAENNAEETRERKEGRAAIPTHLPKKA